MSGCPCCGGVTDAEAEVLKVADAILDARAAAENARRVLVEARTREAALYRQGYRPRTAGDS